MYVSAEYFINRKKNQDRFDFWEGYEFGLQDSFPETDSNNLFWLGWGFGRTEKEGCLRPGVAGEEPYGTPVN
jgi:hypothetical protein